MQDVIASATAKPIVACPTPNQVIQGVTGTGEVAAAGTINQALDIGTQRITRHIGPNGVASFTRQLDHLIADFGDLIGVVSRPTTHAVVTGAANQHVITSATFQDVVAGTTVKPIVAGPTPN
ncbi:hypothetical protein D3C85_1577870 [compost metagenome]